MVNYNSILCKLLIHIFSSFFSCWIFGLLPLIFFRSSWNTYRHRNVFSKLIFPACYALDVLYFFLTYAGITDFYATVMKTFLLYIWVCGTSTEGLSHPEVKQLSHCVLCTRQTLYHWALSPHLASFVSMGFDIFVLWVLCFKCSLF
jgi:hypothetical protein